MRNLLYFISMILIISWAVGFLRYNIGGFYHILLILGVVSLVTWAIRDRNGYR